MMQSLGSWIDVEELEFLANTLVESERRRISAQPDDSPAKAQAWGGDEGAAGAGLGLGVTASDGVTDQGPGGATTGAGELAEDPAGCPDDLATRSGPVNKQLVERVRLKLQALAIEIPQAATLPATADPKVSSPAPGPDFEVAEGTLLQRLQLFADWVSRRVGSMPVVLDHRGDLLGPGSAAEPWYDAVPLAVRALDQIGGLLNAEPESKCSRMAWLAPDDGAGLVVVGADFHGLPVWAGWIETKPLERQTLAQVRTALQQAVTGFDGEPD